MELFIRVIFTIIYLFLMTSASGLRLVQLRVPAHKLQAGTATLRCLFDLEKATLYSVQWYKDGAEFYRYTPEDKPPGQAFPLPGVTVDLEQSNESNVVLRLLTLESGGLYRCEVSTEAPNFLSINAQSNMLVMALPRDSPKISGLAEVYADGEPIEVNCSSARSKPAPVLSWFINDKQVSEMSIRSDSGPWLTQYRVVVGEDRLEDVTLGLKLAANKRFYLKSGNNLRLRCTASLGALQWHTQKSTLLTPKASAASQQYLSRWMSSLFLLFTLKSINLIQIY